MTNLKTILDVASRQLPAEGVDCILIGGFAVNYHGYTRNTLDVDFMIFAEQLDTVRRIMTQAGFTNIAIQDNVAFFSAPGSPLRVDFLRVDRDTMRELLANAILATVQGFEIKVAALRDLIGMKIFALSQDVPRRMGKDLPDIAYLSVLHNLDLESYIQPLCSRFGTSKVYDLIRIQVEGLRTS
ncbi:MAG: nucleotidyl transferase AbiEii/AbiGii toxin family protein [Kiritimatiellae bacterium]|nr:nucleotidyl transferase AbiEii/AbiGii toxin family protein [Kiritimatiellia bacterium]